MLIGYARVSTLDQNPALQRDALTAAGCDKIFTEQASGAQRDRPQLLAALEYLRAGDTLVVWKLDRLARSMQQLIDTVADLHTRQIGFRSLTEQVDTTTAGGTLVFHIFGALAEFERALIRERTRAGLAAARARGRVGGRKRALTPDQVAMAMTLLRDPAITVAQVAAQLRVARATVYASLPPGGRSALTGQRPNQAELRLLIQLAHAQRDGQPFVRRTKLLPQMAAKGWVLAERTADADASAWLLTEAGVLVYRQHVVQQREE